MTAVAEPRGSAPADLIGWHAHTVRRTVPGGHQPAPARRSAARTADALALVFLAALVAASLPVSAADDGSVPRQQLDIAAQRDAVQRRFKEKERDCQERFAVTACLDTAQKERRQALTPLRQEELRLDSLERKQRAAARLEEIEAKQLADAAREDAASSRAPAASQPPGPDLPTRARTQDGKPLLGSRPHPPLNPEERTQREAQSLERYQANQAAASKRREAAAARNAARAASGKVARPLPVPGAASAP